MFELTAAGQTIGLISVGMTLMSSLVRHVVLDKEKLREHKEKIKECQARVKEAQEKKDVKGMQKHQKEMMSCSMEQMKHSMKPMIFTIIPFFLVFGWIRGTYGELGAAYNVTVTDHLPAGVEFTNIDAGELGRYIESERAVEWNWSRLGAGEGAEAGVRLSSGATDYDVRRSPTEVEYTLRNGTTMQYTLPGGAGMVSVNKTGGMIEEGGISYGVSVRNTGSNHVVTLLGLNLGWFAFYFICSFASSMIFNKILGLT